MSSSQSSYGWCVCERERLIHFFFVVPPTVLEGNTTNREGTEQTIHNRRYDSGEYKLLDLKYISPYMLGEYAEYSHYNNADHIKEKMPCSTTLLETMVNYNFFSLAVSK